MPSQTESNKLFVFIGKYELVYFFDKDKKINKTSITSVDIFDFVDQVKDYFENKILPLTFDELAIVLIDTNYTLVPEMIFNKELTVDYLKISQPIFNYEKVYFSENEKNSLVVVYSILEDIEFYLQSKFENFIINHISDLTLNSILPISEKTEIHLVVHKKQAEIILFENKIFVDYQLFEVTTFEDLLYKIQNKMEELNFDKTNTEFYIYNVLSELKSSLKKYLPKPKFVKELRYSL